MAISLPQVSLLCREGMAELFLESMEIVEKRRTGAGERPPRVLTKHQIREVSHPSISPSR